MPVRKLAWPWAVGSGLPAFACYLGWLFYPYWLFLVGFIILAALTVYFIYFFRDPDRTPASSDSYDWLAPADGIVRKIKDDGDGRQRLVIFLTIFNVHLNRMPVAGRIKQMEYTPGQCLPAFKENLESRNERNILTCEDEQGREFEIWQIVGVLARRIHWWVEVEDYLDRGERFGMIAFGSRTDLVLPLDVEPVVEPGETVRAGETVVAQEMNKDD